MTQRSFNTVKGGFVGPDAQPGPGPADRGPGGPDHGRGQGRRVRARPGSLRSGLEKAGADALGVMDLDEAVRLREAGVIAPVFILAGLRADQAQEILAFGLTPFVYDLETARALSRAAAEAGRSLPAYLKIDTGMGRLGQSHLQAEEFIFEAAGLPGLEIAGLATHLAEAEAQDQSFSLLQLERFENLMARASFLGATGRIAGSAANSAGVLALPRARYDLVRPGLMLYGEYPDERLKEAADLKPVMRVVSRVIQVKTLRPGDTVSYGRTWRAERETRIAVVPVGYAPRVRPVVVQPGLGPDPGPPRSRPRPGVHEPDHVRPGKRARSRAGRRSGPAGAGRKRPDHGRAAGRSDRVHQLRNPVQSGFGQPAGNISDLKIGRAAVFLGDF